MRPAPQKSNIINRHSSIPPAPWLAFTGSPEFLTTDDTEYTDREIPDGCQEGPPASLPPLNLPQFVKIGEIGVTPPASLAWNFYHSRSEAKTDRHFDSNLLLSVKWHGIHLILVANGRKINTALVQAILIDRHGPAMARGWGMN